MNEEEYKYLKKKINDVLNIDLSDYKSHQMRRRLDAFISRSNSPNIVSYCKTMERDQEVSQKLRDFLTINVSEFFRDPDQYEVLQKRILPELLKNNQRLNIWSAGCSIGAEPYTVAIILEEISQLNKHRILATDLDMGILKKARAGGPYNSSDVRNIRKDLINKYFTCKNDEYWLVDDIKQQVEFKQHNLLSDDFEKDFDIIICRNVVIYFADEPKRKLYKAFHDSLKEGGVLFIGATETLLGGNNLGLERLCTSFHRKTNLKVQGRTHITGKSLVGEIRRNRVA